MEKRSRCEKKEKRVQRQSGMTEGGAWKEWWEPRPGTGLHFLIVNADSERRTQPSPGREEELQKKSAEGNTSSSRQGHGLLCPRPLYTLDSPPTSLEQATNFFNAVFLCFCVLFEIIRDLNFSKWRYLLSLGPRSTKLVLFKSEGVGHACSEGSRMLL